MDPLHALLRPGMKVTIALDDISLPLPPMAHPGRAADDPGDRARAARRLGRGRRPPDHRQRAAPADDRGGDEADGGLRRSSTPSTRTATTTTTPRTRTAWWSSSAPSHGEVVAINRRAAESDLAHLREHQPRADGRRAQVGGHGAGELRVAARAPQPEDHPRVRELHGAVAQRAAPEHRAHRPGDRQEPEGLPHRDRAEQPHVRRPDRVPGQEGGGLHRVRPAEVPGA